MASAPILLRQATLTLRPLQPDSLENTVFFLETVFNFSLNSGINKIIETVEASPHSFREILTKPNQEIFNTENQLAALVKQQSPDAWEIITGVSSEGVKLGSQLLQKLRETTNKACIQQQLVSRPPAAPVLH